MKIKVCKNVLLLSGVSFALLLSGCKSNLEKTSEKEILSRVFYQAEDSYVHGIEDLDYYNRIKKYDRVFYLHEQFFETFQNQNEESIKKLFLEIREFISSDSDYEEKQFAYPIIYASQELYQDSSNRLLQEEIRKIKIKK